jgi:ATP-dependent helicase/nuclease subunit B
LSPKAVSELAYWKLSGGRVAAEEKPVDGVIADLIAEAVAGLNSLVESFSKADMPYQAVPKPQYQPRYDDYAHLARFNEWGRTGGEE